MVWFRGHDLRVEDHPALLSAAQRGGPVVPFFVWDPSDGFGAGLGAVKQWWLRESLQQLEADLRRLGVQLYMRTGRSTDELRSFLAETGADAVFWNRCYEPDLLTRDEELRVELANEGLTAESFKAELLVEPWELSNTDVAPCFETFHAFMRAWMTVPPPPQPFPYPSRLQPIARPVASVDVDSLGFDVPDKVSESMSKIWKPGSKQAKVQLDKFLHEVFPAFGEGRCRRHFDGTSRLSPHIRFGELSPRRMYHATRLRVSRWDQTSLFHRFGSNLSRKPNVVKQEALTVKETSKISARGPCGNGYISKKRRREATDKAVKEEAGDDRASDDDPRGTSDPDNREGMRAANSKRIAGEKSRRPPSGACKLPSLPHVSLSARAFLKNLCLRDFSYHVLFHNPDFNAKPLIPEFASFPWAEEDGSFQSWREGTTGYPIVDAAMRELRETGWIHNGMRFLLACFLTKYLLLPWPRGLKEFYKLLIDGDHSSNALGWQWTAGSNTDAFPVSCLVNPVRVAYRHDPTGSYVRKWLPELAKLPTEFLHQPWKASQELLKSSGVELGKTYPHRIVLVNEARTRALEAMRVMKRIFSGGSVLRGILDVKDADIIKEWPTEQPEVLQVEDSSSFSGKMNLLPSLWALLQCDQPSNYLSVASVGSDPLIAMDTASLTEGALAMPLGDQHESIEHALITAHAQTPSAAALQVAAEAVEVGRDLDVPTFEAERGNTTLAFETDRDTATPELVPVDSTELEVDPLGGEMKFARTNASLPQKPERFSLQPTQSSIEEAPSPEQGRGKNSSSPVPTSAPFGQYPSQTPTSAPNGGASHPHYGRQPQTQQQLQSFQQLQQLQQFHQLQQFNLLQQQQQSHHPQRPPHPQHVLQQRAQAHSVMDNVYAPGAGNGAVPGPAVTGVPMPAPPIVVGPATSSPEANGSTVFPATESTGGMYAHQFGMNQFYGFHPMLPVANPHALGASEGGDMSGAGGAANNAKVGVPSVLPMGYGMYGPNAFDPAIISNTFAQNGTSYGTIPVSAQQHSVTGAQHPYGLPPHPMYFGGAQGNDMLHPQASGGIPSQLPGAPQAAKLASGNMRSSVSPTNPNATAVAAAAAAVAAGGRQVEINVASEAYRNTLTAKHLPEMSRGDSQKNARPSSTPLQGDPVRSSGSELRGPRGTSGRPNARSTSRLRGSGRGRRNSSNSGGRQRADSRTQTSPRSNGDGSISLLQQRNGQEGSQHKATNLKTRQEILAAVLAKKDHDYHGFAQYLSATYELTGNTDRHTSKDYIRLCNLKDDYHKQCVSEKDKLKIYRIKAFFSKILKLEVTGEWDRHNHGGVRGPYVYGIRARQRMERPQDDAQGVG